MFLELLDYSEEYQAAISDALALWTPSDDNPGASYTEMFLGGNEEVAAQFSLVAAAVVDENFEPLEEMDFDTFLTEAETLIGMTEVQAALAATFAEVLAAWNAISEEV